MLADQIRQLINQSITRAGLPTVDFSVKSPTDQLHGDYSSNVAMILARRVGRSPQEIAQQITDNLPADPSIAKTEIAGRGFVNFWLSENYLLDRLDEIIESKDNFGTNSFLAGKKYLVEFGHPNTHKLFHIGHLRNLITGQAIANILEAGGAQVNRANYQGDIGLHIAKAIWGIKNLKDVEGETIARKIYFLGQSYIKGSQAYEDGSAKDEIDNINQKIYQQSDPKLNKLYLKTRQWSLRYFEQVYQRLGVKFDRLYFESEVAESGKKLAEKALSDGILIKSQNAVIYPGSQFGLHDRVFITQAGMPTYEAKDLALAILQFKEFEPNQILHVVSSEQSAYFAVLFQAMAKILPISKAREKHLIYGWVRLKEGKISSRAGNIIEGGWLLDEVKKQISQRYQLSADAAEQLAQGAIRYSFLKVNLASEISFDITESISLSGNSGPYLQYTYARIYGLARKAKVDAADFLAKTKIDKIRTEESKLIRLLVQYGEVIEKAELTYSPNAICEYLYHLTEEYNSFYDSVRILDDNEEIQHSRLLISLLVAQVLKSGLNLLGISTLEKL